MGSLGKCSVSTLKGLGVLGLPDFQFWTAMAVSTASTNTRPAMNPFQVQLQPTTARLVFC